MTTEARTWHVSPWVSIPRLEAILQCGLSDITWATLVRLVSEGTAEDLSIDFKGAMYVPGEKGNFELAKDVAAFSNASGGLIVVGIGESGGRASGFARQVFSDNDVRHARTVLLQRLAPFVEDLEVGVIDSPDGTSSCLLILVPSSTQSPHAVLSSKQGGQGQESGFWWPVREGSQTRWLREAELAGRYRERFTARYDVTARGRTVLTDGTAALERTYTPWLAVSLVPTSAPRERSLSAAFREEVLRETTIGGYTGYPFSSCASYARGRVILNDRFEPHHLSRDHHNEFYVDGSAMASVSIRSDVPHEVRNGRIQAPHELLQAASSEDVATWLVRLVSICARHAVAFGSSGYFYVTAQLVMPLEEDDSSIDAPSLVLEERQQRTVVLTQMNRVAGVSLVPGSFPISKTTPVSVTATAAIVSNPRDLATTCSELAHEIYSEFGQFPTQPLIGQSGSVANEASAFPRYAPFRDWADANGLMDT